MDLAMAQRLVDRRKAAGLSQEALAAQLGVSRQAVSKWERSESSPDTDNLIALAALYGVSLDELLMGRRWLALMTHRLMMRHRTATPAPKLQIRLKRLRLLLSTLIAAISHLSIFPSRAVSTSLIPIKARKSMLVGAASM